MKMERNMISKKAKAINKVLEVIKFKETMNFENPRRTLVKRVPLLLNFQNEIEHHEIHGRDVYNIIPDEHKTEHHVIFFHGGGYANEASINHYLMINKFINAAKCTVTFVEYPLAPEATAYEAIKMAYDTYLTQLAAYANHRFTIMGDSAGGGLALSLAMKIRDEKIKQPEKIILFSPWLDIALTNPQIKEVYSKDLILNIDALLDIGSIYAHDLPFDDYRVSPKFGDLNHLGKILVLVGSDEIFYPDCLAFMQQTGLVGTHITGTVYEDMQHDFMILPIPEQEIALEEAVTFLNSD